MPELFLVSLGSLCICIVSLFCINNLLTLYSLLYTLLRCIHSIYGLTNFRGCSPSLCIAKGIKVFDLEGICLYHGHKIFLQRSAHRSCKHKFRWGNLDEIKQ